MKLIINYNNPPIPLRDFDWEVYEEGTEDLGMVIGHGKTKQEAIDDFKESYLLRHKIEYNMDYKDMINESCNIGKSSGWIDCVRKLDEVLVDMNFDTSTILTIIVRLSCEHSKYKENLNNKQNDNS